MENRNEILEQNMVLPETWTLDPAHSKIQFIVRHMVISEVLGNFKTFNLKIDSKKDDFSDSKVELQIQVDSIDTGVSGRDNHLKSADFFEVKKYPFITFKSKSFKKISGEKYKLTGDLTIKNITKEIEFDVVYNGQIADPFGGKQRAGFKVNGMLNRFDYDLKWNMLIESGGAVVGKNVNIICDIEIVSH
jgi:polyisoprenoid-binding protein YceI